MKRNTLYKDCESCLNVIHSTSHLRLIAGAHPELGVRETGGAGGWRAACSESAGEAGARRGRT